MHIIYLKDKNQMKVAYLNYSKYLFLIFLVYTIIILTNRPVFNFTYTDIVLGSVLPFLPVWLSFYIAKKFNNDLEGSLLNSLTLLVPALIVAVEVYFIYIKSLVSHGTGSGLIWAFGTGTIIFFIAYGASLILSVFSNTHNKPLKQDF
jgi:hypothetical protein